jgi:hypothetical protein
MAYRLLLQTKGGPNFHPDPFASEADARLVGDFFLAATWTPNPHGARLAGQVKNYPAIAYTVLPDAETIRQQRGSVQAAA